MHPRMRGCGPRRGNAATVPFCSHEPPYPVHHYAPPMHEGGWGGSPFGVRRPLRFLAWKLGLDENQITRLAAILDELKTERAQAEVDERRALTLIAEIASAETFDEARAAEALRTRVHSAERLQAQVLEALRRIHALLQPQQRERFAYLLRTGSIMV